MKKRIIYSMLMIGGMLIITSGMVGIQSNGAPIASTNAPGETTCNRSSCHTGSPLNSGNGTLEIVFGDGKQEYIPGLIYDITVSLKQTGIERFGFQALILRDEDSTNAGEFIVADSVRTKVINGVNQYTGRKYMTYKYRGTDPAAPGLGQWSFKWKAPMDSSTPVTLYVASAAANNDATDYGDLIYTRQLTLPPAHSSSKKPRKLIIE